MFNFFKNKKNTDKPLESKDAISVKIGYTFEWNDDVPLEERNTAEFPSRLFCATLLKNNKIYNRYEIELMSQRLGYSVWEHKGGEGCRHKWVSRSIIKKIEK